MKAYEVPFPTRMLILSTLGLPFLFQTKTALAVFLPLAAWMVWGDWRVILVNQAKIRFRTSWFGAWQEVDWSNVSRADWVAFDTASLSLDSGQQITVPFGGLSDQDRSEAAGWLNQYCRTGLRKIPEVSEQPAE